MFFASTAVVRAPAARVWEFVERYDNDPLWRAGVTRMHQSTAGPVHEGADVEEELRMLGRTIRSRVTVEHVQPGRSFEWRVVDGAHAHGRRWVRAIDEHSTELGTEKTVLLHGPDRLLTPIVALVTRRTERADVRRAAALIESATLGGKR